MAFRNGFLLPSTVGPSSNMRRWSDRGLKVDREPAVIYARCGIPVYWIVNLIDRLIEVRTNPTPSGYTSRVDYSRGQHVPVVIDGIEVGQIAVADIALTTSSLWVSAVARSARRGGALGGRTIGSGAWRPLYSSAGANLTAPDSGRVAQSRLAHPHLPRS